MANKKEDAPRTKDDDEDEKNWDMTLNTHVSEGRPNT
jgi:hypothetical protein